MPSLGTLDGVLGTWEFDDNGDTSLAIVAVQEFSAGQWQTLESISTRN